MYSLLILEREIHGWRINCMGFVVHVWSMLRIASHLEEWVAVDSAVTTASSRSRRSATRRPSSGEASSLTFGSGFLPGLPTSSSCLRWLTIMTIWDCFSSCLAWNALLNASPSFSYHFDCLTHNALLLQLSYSSHFNSLLFMLDSYIALYISPLFPICWFGLIVRE